jgi:hypothetical protein
MLIMSVKDPSWNDLHVAGLTGMGHFNGDPEVAADLGIPTSPEGLDQNIVSSAAFASAIHDAHMRRDAYQYQANTGNYAAVVPAQRIINHRGSDQVTTRISARV